jgi:hypothetical protein
LVVAFAGWIGLAGCSKHADSVTNPSTPPTPQHTTNSPPDTWFAGPDPTDASAGWQTDAGPFGGLFIPAPVNSWNGWYNFAGVPNSMLSADSLRILPKDRLAQRTFLEVYGDRVWLRQEGDTVHINSIVIFPTGGYDLDSPYSVLVNQALLPYELSGSPVFTPGDANGSPVGFRLRVTLRDVLGRVSLPSESTTYPVYDPVSVFHMPVVNGYQTVRDAGRAYAVARAVDGDGAVDRRIDRQPGEAVGIVDRVDAGGGSPQDVALRSKILTFYVDHPPQLLQGDPGFRPVAHQVFTSRSLRALTDLALLATDDDPYDALAAPARPGGPSGSPILRRRIAILGKFTGDPARDTCYVVPDEFTSAPINLTIPDWIANGPITLLVRLCDCFSCDVRPGPGACPAFAGFELRPTFGSCVDTSIPCQLSVPGPAAMLAR